MLLKRFLNEIFNKLVDELEKILPGFGKNLAIDGKAISSLAGHENKNKEKYGRRDIDSDLSKKEYKGKNKNGTAWSKIVKWFGQVTSNKQKPPGNQKKCETVEADRGYDDTKLIIKLWDEYKIKPVIDIRNMWKDGEKTRQLSNIKNVVYNYKGNVYCYCLETGERREMCNGGIEKDRNMLKKYVQRNSTDLNANIWLNVQEQVD
ncbi:MAG: hypothetical protein QME35_00280 [Thermoanaerobacteraceae bacterium]|nr:hypothetical protein [Thermoanaerobacteraceae bacterium]